MTLSLRAGVDWKLEAVANELLATHRATCTTTDEKTEFLTDAQMELRLDREVYNGFGLADSNLFSGIYHRVYREGAGQRPSRHRRTED